MTFLKDGAKLFSLKAVLELVGLVSVFQERSVRLFSSLVKAGKPAVVIGRLFTYVEREIFVIVFFSDWEPLRDCLGVFPFVLFPGCFTPGIFLLRVWS